MKKFCAAATALALTALLAGCSAQEEAEPLPESMDEETVLAAGETILDQLLAGEYGTVYEEFREDVRETLTTEDIQNLVEPVFEEAGEYQAIESSDTVGSTEGEEHGIARFLCTFSEEDVAVNMAFDTQMELIGLSAGVQTSGWSFSNLTSNLSGLFGR